MKILITNNRLDFRGGAENFVRDLARSLQGLGHTVMAYSSDPTQRERLLENDVVPVTTDLERLPFTPDIIHAQHHLDAMTALCDLPHTPAIYHCHGAVWREAPPKHPRIYRYLAMARTLRDRIIIESNLDPSRVDVFLNPIDLARFSEVRKLPAKPARALFFNSRHPDDSPTLQAVQEALSRAGIALDFLGPRYNNATVSPEKLLPTYDLVFASGRSAIEALASGCAVIVLGRTSCGEMVDPENFERLRAVNFSIAVNTPPSTVAHVEAELARFSTVRCAEVSARIREKADIRKAVIELTGIYEQAIALHQHSKCDPCADLRATAKYLRKIVPLIKMTDNMLRGDWSSVTRANNFNDLRAQVTLMQEKLDQAQ